MSIKILKLVSGEAIISDIEEKEEGKIEIGVAFMIQLVPTEQGIAMAFVPWMPFCKEKVMLNDGMLMTPAMEPEFALRNEYNKLTGGVVAPPEKEIFTGEDKNKSEEGIIQFPGK